MAVGVSAVSIKVAHDDRARDTRYSVRAQVRNLSANEARFGLTTLAWPQQTLEYRGRVHNWGNVDAKDVTLDVTVPAASAGSYIRGSCRVRYPDQRETRCQDRMDERSLHRNSLEANAAIEVRFRFKTRIPPCDGFRARTTFTVRSADRTAETDTSTITVGRRTEPVTCGTDDATLMGLIPLDYRDGCELSSYNKVVGDARAHIRCADPGGDISTLDYFLYESEQRVKRTYRRRLEAVGRSARRQCASDPDGEGYQSYSGRSRHEIRYFCWWSPSTGNAWIELYNRRHKLFIAASRSDARFRELFDWINMNTP